MKDFVSRYMSYVDLAESEAPAAYHRWTCMSIVGALMGRQIYLPFGHSVIYPNQYIMLMGTPGTRKGTAMSIGKQLLKATGFTRFAPDRASKERFLMEFKQYEIDASMELEELEAMVFDTPAEIYVMSGEFTDFIGQGDMDYITLLTNLWDNLEKYQHPKIHGKSVEVFKPTVNLFGGNTVDGFTLAFPPESIGNGFMSRVIFVHGDPTGVKTAWPEPADPLVQVELAGHLKTMRENVTGSMTVSPKGKEIAKRIYQECVTVDDPRFSYYNTRRHTHLLKLSMLLAALDLSTQITDKHFIRANTFLVNTERKMPQSLGEYGKSKNSGPAGMVLEFLSQSVVPKNAGEIYKHLSTTVAKQSELVDILAGLRAAEKIKVITFAGKPGYVRNHVARPEWPAELLEPEWLTTEEYR